MDDFGSVGCFDFDHFHCFLFFGEQNTLECGVFGSSWGNYGPVCDGGNHSDCSGWRGGSSSTDDEQMGDGWGGRHGVLGGANGASFLRRCICYPWMAGCSSVAFLVVGVIASFGSGFSEGFFIWSSVFLICVVYTAWSCFYALEFAPVILVGLRGRWRWIKESSDVFLFSPAVAFLQFMVVFVAAFLINSLFSVRDYFCGALLFVGVAFVADFVNFFVLRLIKKVYASANPLRVVFWVVLFLVSGFMMHPWSGGFLSGLIYSKPAMGGGSCVIVFVKDEKNVRPSLISDKTGHTKDLRVLYASSNYLYVRLISDEKTDDGSKRLDLPIAQPLPLSAVRGYDGCKAD